MPCSARGLGLPGLHLHLAISWSRATCCAACSRSTCAPPADISGAAVTLITFLDFTLVRQRFCTTVCPYGYLQGMLGDGNTLLVHYRDENHACIECKKCVRVCPMGIDIRKSPFQIECVHCGECIDACDEIMARLKKPGLIHYAWGEKGAPDAASAWYRRSACATPSAWSSLLVLLCYASGLFVGAGDAPRRAGAGRRRSAPRSTASAPTAASTTSSATRIANRGSKPAAVVFSIAAPARSDARAWRPIR